MRIRESVLALVGILFASGTARADEVIDWNNVLLDTIRVVGGSPCPISRTGAMVHVAIYDAVNSITPTHEPYLAIYPVDSRASPEAAVAAAAHHVLVDLYPDL